MLIIASIPMSRRVFVSKTATDPKSNRIFAYFCFDLKGREGNGREGIQYIRFYIRKAAYFRVQAFCSLPERPYSVE